ncbi:Transcription initiation factor IID 31kD subunit [Phytophthora infestans]|uniref:Transcription initiation factor IID 31kD subunit n=1 Tax=Phytophthora infestans TaxID=4787 RepID=A0A8S9V7B2_PHYIN|nr:Transcription initiation factor IID 31kD subunit [Phytophthora infestans]
MGGDKVSKGTKRLHEDDGDAHRRDEGANVQPLDVLSMQQLLESMGADKFEPRVVAQLQEFVHRYVTEILVDAQEYSMYADKQTIDADDIRLAISSRLNHHYAQVPPRELMMELADKRNSIPLPPISNEYGVRLPQLQYQLVTKESDRHEPQKTPNTPRLGDTTGFGAGLRGEAARPPIHPRIEGSRNKKYARRPIPINLNSNM